MDPISAGLGIVGFGMQLFGGMGASKTASQMAQVNMGVAADEQQINAARQQQMQMEARRMQMETLRNSQRQRARGINATVNQGAQFGSGMGGALAENTAQTDVNLQGINQNLAFGNTIFGINNDISGKKMQLASLGGTEATDQALSSLGGALVKSGPTIGGLVKDATKGMSGFTGFAGPYV